MTPVIFGNFHIFKYCNNSLLQCIVYLTLTLQIWEAKSSIRLVLTLCRLLFKYWMRLPKGRYSITRLMLRRPLKNITVKSTSETQVKTDTNEMWHYWLCAMLAVTGFITCAVADSSVFDDIVTVKSTQGADLLLEILQGWLPVGLQLLHSDQLACVITQRVITAKFNTAKVSLKVLETA